MSFGLVDMPERLCRRKVTEDMPDLTDAGLKTRPSSFKGHAIETPGHAEVIRDMADLRYESA